MNICLVTLNPLQEPGGLSTYYSQLARLLADGGHRIFILTPDQQARPDDEDETQENGRITTLIFRQSYAREKAAWSPYFRPGGFELPNWIAIGHCCRQWLQTNSNRLGIDLVQVPDYGGIGAFLTGKDMPPLLIFGHGCLLQITRYNPYQKKDEQLRILLALEKTAFGAATGIATHSRMNQQELEQLTGRPVACTLPPWNGIPPDIHGTQTGEIAVAGSLQPVKGALVTAAALNLTRVRFPELTINWYGVDTASGTGNQSVYREITAVYPSVAGKQFHWQGPLEHTALLPEIARARFVVVPSVWETFSWSAIEAAALGKALIITAGAGASGLFTDGQNALIIPPDDPEALAAALERLFTDTELVRTLGVAAKEMVESTLQPALIVADRIHHAENLITQPAPESGRGDNTVWLADYRHPFRKWYFSFRAGIKKMIKHDA